MFKSKIFLKSMFIVTSMILIYTLLISIFTIPKVENSIKKLEERNAQETLKQVVIIVNNVHKDLENFKKIVLQKHKEDLTNLTDTVWSIVNTKYNQSKLENVGVSLKKRSIEFKSNLMKFYHNNKNKMTEKELKNAIINYINIYRYDNNVGYFWINNLSAKMIVHPVVPELNGTDLKNYKDSDGVYIFNKMIEKIKSQGSGIVKYKWLNPKSKKIEDKISYVFEFEPFNWLIGTGEYYSVLKERLQSEVFELISKAKYADDNYFFISDYKSNLLSHPYLKGKDLSNVKDRKGEMFMPSMIKIAREKGEGFYSYWWTKNKYDSNDYEKLSFIRDFPDWNIVIGTGLYIDDIDKEVAKRKEKLMKQLRSVIMNTKFGKTGYLYIFDTNGKMLIHPNENLDNNENFYKVPTPNTGTLIYDDLVNASKTNDKSLYYKWDKPSDKGNYIYDKISWVEYIPEQGLYIASSVYTEEFKESANNIRDYVIVIALIVLILSLIYSFVFFKNLLIPLNKLSNLVSKVSLGDYSTRFHTQKKDDEIHVLAKNFNNMLETIENRTSQLQESNDKLEEMINNLKKTQKKLVETEKLATIGRLVSGVTHAINRPISIGLTASSHFSFLLENLKYKLENEDLSREELQNTIKEVDKLSSIVFANFHETSDIVNNFKQVAIDQTSEQKRFFNLKEYTKGLLFSMDNIITENKINITIKCDNDLNINSYPGQYSQIVTNLILNSIKHGFKPLEGGNINIDISIENNNLVLVYTDDGVGISKEHLSKIFDHFFTTNKNNEHRGLGLNIIHNIVNTNLKGTITCASKKDEGVRFEIVFPL